MEIQLHKALARGKFVKVNGRQVWTKLRYEKLPGICFNCGSILHDEGGCKKESGAGRERGEESVQFGSWLRANVVQKGRHNGNAGKGKTWWKDAEKEIEKEKEGARSEGMSVNEVCLVMVVEKENISKEGGGVDLGEELLNANKKGREENEGVVESSECSSQMLLTDKHEEGGVVKKVSDEEKQVELVVKKNSSWKRRARDKGRPCNQVNLVSFKKM